MGGRKKNTTAPDEDGSVIGASVISVWWCSMAARILKMFTEQDLEFFKKSWFMLFI